ncbi:MAG TPA: CAP domain-containing protein [Polyangiaceae bacterium]|nr:CAP domain-containing protein [Polyangiaceae bacterium]
MADLLARPPPPGRARRGGAWLALFAPFAPLAPFARRVALPAGVAALALGAAACRSRSPSQPAYPPPGGYAQNGYPPGNYPPGNYPPGNYPPGSYPPGSYPPGSYPPGGYPPGGQPPGSYPPPPAPTGASAPPAPWGLPLPPGFVLPPPLAWFPGGGAQPAPPGPTPPAPPAGNHPAAWAALEQEVLARTNAVRARGATCGSQSFGPAAPLEAHPALQAAARGHSLDMATNNYFDHESRDGRTMVTRVRAAGYTGGAIGENIAAGRPTAEAVVDQWVHSPGHCANLMGREFRFLGVGYAFRPGSRFGHYWTQNFGG